MSDEIELKNEKQKRFYSDKVISCSNDSALFYTFSYPDKQSKSIKLYYYHIKNGSTGSYEIFKTGQNKNLFSSRVFSFLIVQQKIIVITPDEIYTFCIDKGKLIHKTLQKNKKSYKKIYRLNDSICLLYQHYNFHPLDQLEKHVWAHYYLQKDSISDFTNMSETDSKFSQRTNSWLSVYNGLIASSRSSEYSIQFYNPEFKLLDSIYTSELDSNKLYMNQLPNGGSLESLVGTIKVDDSLLTRIVKIYLVDSTHILVMLKFPNAYKPKNYRLDLWECMNGKWALVRKEFQEQFYSEGTKYDETNQPIIGLFGDFAGVEIIDKCFYFIDYPFIEKIITESFNRDKDYELELNQKIKRKELYFGIYKRRMKL